MTPIRIATNTALAPIRVGLQPVALAITPDGKTLYVLNNVSGTVTPIRTATRTALTPIPVGQVSAVLVMAPDGKTVYVHGPGETVLPIRTATNTALKPIKIGRPGAGAFTIAITPDGKMAYTANAFARTVTPIRIATNTALRPIKAGTEPDAITIAPTLNSPCHRCI